MKIKIIAIAMGVSLAVSAARGTPTPNTLFIIESGENLFAIRNGGLLASSRGGVPPSFVKINDVTDNWTIDFLDGWTITGFTPFEELGEPEGGRGPDIGGEPGALLENILTRIGETRLTWQSDIDLSLFSRISISRVFPNVLIDPDGTTKFDVIVADVPELPSTISIFGIALAGLAWFARFRRRAM